MTGRRLGSRRLILAFAVMLARPELGRAAAPAAPEAAGAAMVGDPGDNSLAPSRAIEPPDGPGLFAVAGESICGPKDCVPWTPIPFRTLLTEGWRDPGIVASPAPAVPCAKGGSGRPTATSTGSSPNHINEIFDVAQGGHGYAVQYDLYTPLSRRLLLLTKVPDLNANAPSLNLPATTFGTSGASTNRVAGRGTSFGDLTITPRVMLAESQARSLSVEISVQIPPGRRGAGRAGRSSAPASTSGPTSRPPLVGAGRFHPERGGQPARLGHDADLAAHYRPDQHAARRAHRRRLQLFTSPRMSPSRSPPGP